MRQWTRGVALLLCSLCLPAHAGAQELASTFDQLRVLVKAGDWLTLTDDVGQQVEGRLVRLSSSSLELGLGDGQRAFAEADVRTIRRRGDSIANGAKWGAGFGLGFGILGAIALGDELDPAAVPFVVAVYAAFGTGVGVGVDALVRGRVLIFSRPGRAALQLAPIVTRRSAGAAAVLRF